MIFIDANILLYAEDSLHPRHAKAREWWDAQLSGNSTVCLCWPVLTAFIRIGTNTRVFANPLTLEEAVTRVESWVRQPCVRLVHPTDKHWDIFREMLNDAHATGNIVTDAHLAALAVEHGCELYSTDSDFARFRQLKWQNPLAD